ncbi:citrate synthase [Raineyella sp. LH-20]|uniref:citrate synthase n=1 Tax=Raineyella sp. LH-20 TaxID=3081204 RepID=UPI002953CC60|nr:citrate synthase [Raineyella sp. LH-20]WOP18933.1 citrate synthase [Raineyella sp. LH-20]
MGETLTIRDNRTGETYELPVSEGTVRAKDLFQIHDAQGRGLVSFDPGMFNTATCHSSVAYIHGDKGILDYRGYPIEELAERCSYLEVAYLLAYGELPTSDQLAQWEYDINHHMFIPENVKKLIDAFPYDAHPMAKLMSAVSSLHAFYPESREADLHLSPHLQIRRLIAKMPTLAAFSYRHSAGLPFVYPRDDISYVENFMRMLFMMGERDYRPDPRLVRALEVLFVLHADHEQNCSTTTVRTVASSGNGPYTCVSAGIGALFGPLHGGANEAVLRMLREIGDVANVPEFIAGVKSGGARLMGFGHRVYKNYDPRARIIKSTAHDVFEVTGVNPLLQIALELERIALEDDYFVTRRLYPNVDFYSGLIYEALGFAPEMFTVLFAIPRTAGWLAQWLEGANDPEQKIVRPKQIYTGAPRRHFVPIDQRC